MKYRTSRESYSGAVILFLIGIMGIACFVSDFLGGFGDKFDLKSGEQKEQIPIKFYEPKLISKNKYVKNK